jgi:hypothetical protein
MQDKVSLDTLENAETKFERPRIRCKACHLELTRTDYALSPEGFHEHMQVNPGGVTFVFRCFSQAAGCSIQGKPEHEHSWFTGYTWQFALCRQCGSHLGWLFRHSGEDSFFGLISDRIIQS